MKIEKKALSDDMLDGVAGGLVASAPKTNGVLDPEYSYNFASAAQSALNQEGTMIRIVKKDEDDAAASSQIFTAKDSV